MISYTTESTGLTENFKILDALCREYSKQSLGHFLNSIVIPGDPPRPFGHAADPWQRELLAPMIPAFEGLADIASYAGPSCFMHILSRGHAKSSVEACLAIWLCLASRRPIHGYILAADRDQGKIIIQAAADTLRLNPWLTDVQIQRNAIRGPGGFVEVLPADVGSMYGLQGNFYVCDEIVHWKSQEPWTALFSGTAKISPCITCVMSNAGLLDSWQHKLYTDYQTDKDWVIFHRPGFIASWMSRTKVESIKQGLPPSEADRLFENRWIDPAEEHDYLRRSEVEACGRNGVTLNLSYRLRPQIGISNYVAGIDYGPKKDRTALAVVHQDVNGVVIVDRLDVWERSSGRSVQVSAVEEWIREVNRTFRPRTFVLDEYQMEGSAQMMESSGIPVERFDFRGGHGNFALAQSLRMLVADQRLAWYPSAGRMSSNDDLSSELIGLRVKRMQYGYRFDHENQKHDDRAFAVGIAAMRALEHPYTKPITRPAVAPVGPPRSVPFER